MSGCGRDAIGERFVYPSSLVRRGGGRGGVELSVYGIVVLSLEG